MCKVNDYKVELAHYIHEMLDIDVCLRQISKGQLNTLPLSIAGNFRFYEAEMLQRQVVFALVEEGDTVPPAQMKRMMNIVANKLGRTTILVPSKIASYNLQRLIRQRINLIVPGKQMFLPELLINLHRDVRTDKDLPALIPPLAQVIILYHIERESLEGRNAQEVSERFDVSYATANRANRWLYSHGLCSLSGGKTKSMHFEQGRRDLWEAAKPLLMSPVERTIYTDERMDSGMICGINALSEYSMLASEQRQWHAVTKEQLTLMHIQTNGQFGNNIIELWRYKPEWLSTTATVDRLSLYLSLESNEDERVQKELDNMINSSIKW